jgi:hypothetical protein
MSHGTGGREASAGGVQDLGGGEFIGAEVGDATQEQDTAIRESHRGVPGPAHRQGPRVAERSRCRIEQLRDICDTFVITASDQDPAILEEGRAMGAMVMVHRSGLREAVLAGDEDLRRGATLGIVSIAGDEHPAVEKERGPVIGACGPHVLDTFESAVGHTEDLGTGDRVKRVQSAREQDATIPEDRDRSVAKSTFDERARPVETGGLRR